MTRHVREEDPPGGGLCPFSPHKERAKQGDRSLAQRAHPPTSEETHQTHTHTSKPIGAQSNLQKLRPRHKSTTWQPLGPRNRRSPLAREASHQNSSHDHATRHPLGCNAMPRPIAASRRVAPPLVVSPCKAAVAVQTPMR
ncbi:hypothetical protein TraAM80_04138 [Trypanosoma rangeli]|uniref:Uncharacterized protein n=1 Tax=Trypanosoma rangeli TaxID=5698 RepID=A0A422NL30_TRYRA|nr:uncharacterized protein TraAM80_04138 [Trypanosoma rangeli]RNF06156.1 hypothetical protein TraAM80_04138 [Trypanosoma rangeli]|eukprot:RNF06156.1 hypothetical protein TraAM80_04138 [Trypanosoma rangeli]